MDCCNSELIAGLGSHPEYRPCHWIAATCCCWRTFGATERRCPREVRPWTRGRRDFKRQTEIRCKCWRGFFLQSWCCYGRIRCGKVEFFSKSAHHHYHCLSNLCTWRQILTFQKGVDSLSNCTICWCTCEDLSCVTFEVWGGFGRSLVHKSEERWIDMRFLLAPWKEDSVVDCKLFPACNRGCGSVWNSAAWRYWEISAHEGCKRSCWLRLYLAMEVSQNLCKSQPAIITGVLCYEFLFWEDVTQIANSCPCTIHFDYFQ